MKWEFREITNNFIKVRDIKLKVQNLNLKTRYPYNTLSRV